MTPRMTFGGYFDCASRPALVRGAHPHSTRHNTQSGSQATCQRKPFNVCHPCRATSQVSSEWAYRKVHTQALCQGLHAQTPQLYPTANPGRRNPKPIITIRQSSCGAINISQRPRYMTRSGYTEHRDICHKRKALRFKLVFRKLLYVEPRMVEP